ncbi:Hypothetical predicted protein [Marmota monax]|uniref:Uncharacterized protein n=1 Tax=Marmota monax TaxID=9995 RepID=A0A5E4BX73_MARMO|nr:hypothetical protein GHT09_014268 [Marmota monax]VTJ74223.1 Hypothetical predicted protein [Marmota monax]
MFYVGKHARGERHNEGISLHFPGQTFQRTQRRSQWPGCNTRPAQAQESSPGAPAPHFVVVQNGQLLRLKQRPRLFSNTVLWARPETIRCLSWFRWPRERQNSTFTDCRKHLRINEHLRGKVSTPHGK